ncbi:MAG: POTRA domain-containing protein, partial [Thermoanaerobaculaceae bacterium]
MRRLIGSVSLWFFAEFLWAGAPVVKEVEVVGGTTLTPDTVEYYLGVAPGDPYDAEEIAKNFHRFWDSGLLEDLKVEVEELGEGQVKLVVSIKERVKVSE